MMRNEDKSVQEISDKEFASIYRKTDAGKFRSFDDCGDERCHEIFKRGHDTAECGADDHADCQIDGISPKNELL